MKSEFTRLRSGIGTASILALILVGLAVAPASRAAQANYDETKVPKYVLPDPLVLANGKWVTDVKTWEQKRRPEILELFKEQMYGRSPAKRAPLLTETISVDTKALGGLAVRKQVTIHLDGTKAGPTMEMLLYLPANAKDPVPVFLGLNFNGNQSVRLDPEIRLTERWMRNDREGAVVNNRATEKTRGMSASRWAIEKILARGFGLATVYYGDLEPDHNEGWKTGIRAAFSKQGADTKFKPDDWGAIRAWAWGLSRAMDYLENDPHVDAKKVAVLGHSRLGKTSLWAGAQDERFAVVISNDSGCGGAALSRRQFGETVERINTSFPHWFCGNFKQYNGQEERLPMDQHMLIALMAPRPVYVASAADDQWADPKGEFLAAKHAGPVYALYGLNGVGVYDQPKVNHPVGDAIGYHVRTGKHDVTDYDWEQYLNFAARHFGMK